MPRYFHIDRRGTLTPGQELNRRPLTFNAGTPQEFIDHANARYPNGLSDHGLMYFLNGDISSGLALADAQARTDAVRNQVLELVFEGVRQASFPDRPSRFESVFAWKSLSEAKAFQRGFGGPTARIVRVESDDAFRADMNLLSLGTILVTSYYAHEYWGGKRHPLKNPAWEYLLRPPVHVISIEK